MEMSKDKSLVPPERIERSILLIRIHKVMLDSDLAELYGVTTKRLNEQVRRNLSRFPEDFLLQLTMEEARIWWTEVRGGGLRSQIVTLKGKTI
jgi:ORF6N domain